MEEEHKAVGDAHDLTMNFERIEGVKESLEPNWSELEVFSNGDLKRLMSSDVEERFTGREMHADALQVHSHEARLAKLLKVEEEFAPREERGPSDDPEGANCVGVEGSLGRGSNGMDTVSVDNVSAEDVRVHDGHRMDPEVGNAVGLADVYGDFGVEDSLVMDSEVAKLVGMADIRDIFAVPDCVDVNVANAVGEASILDHFRVQDSNAIHAEVTDVVHLTTADVNYGSQDGAKMDAEAANVGGAANRHEYGRVLDSIEMDSQISSDVGLPNFAESIGVQDNIREEMDKGLLTLESVNCSLAGEVNIRENAGGSYGCRGGHHMDVEVANNHGNSRVLDRVMEESIISNAVGVPNISSVHIGVPCNIINEDEGVLEVPIKELSPVSLEIRSVGEVNNPVISDAQACRSKQGVMPEEVDQKAVDVETTDAKKILRTQAADVEETRDVVREAAEEEVIYERAFDLMEAQESKIGPEFIADMLRDGTLSVDGLASKGFVLVDDDETDSNDVEDSDRSEEGNDEESNEASSSDSDEEDEEENLNKPTNGRKVKVEMEDSEDTGPPRTKHELDVLPPVPKVTAVLESRHKTVSVGSILSVLDLSVIVEASNEATRVLNDNSIVWLTEGRVPLGIVDEVFGPVKKPFYLLRFNEASEIPEEAKTGVDVSYVAEFAEFVLKDNPSLHRKGVDASGLDDEEVASDEEVEFSDDEKEAAARLKRKSKRGLDSQENGASQERNSGVGQHTKGQRRERGKGRGRSGWHDSATSNAVDSAVKFVAGMDLQGPPLHSSWHGPKQQRDRNRGHFARQKPQQTTGLQGLQFRGSRTGPRNESPNFGQHREFAQRRDESYFAEQANTQMRGSVEFPQRQDESYFVGQAKIQVCSNGEFPQRRDEPYFAEQADIQMLSTAEFPQRRDEPYFTEQSNIQLRSSIAAQQGHQVLRMQGIPVGAGGLPAHFEGPEIPRQQPISRFQPAGYNNTPRYDVQFSTSGQQSFSAGPAGPQFNQSSGLLNNPSLYSRSYLNHQGQVPVNTTFGPGLGSNVHAPQMNYGLHQPYPAFMGSSPTFNGGLVVPEFIFQSMPQNNLSIGPAGLGGASISGQRGLPTGYPRSFLNNNASQGQ